MMERKEKEEGRMSNEDATPPPSSNSKGGLVTMPFIIVNETFEKVASFGVMPSMILYLKHPYHMSMVDAINVTQLWSSFSNLLAMLGAFLSDSYLGRFQVIVIGSISSLLGLTLLWLTAMLPPPPGKSPDSGQFTLLISSLVLMSIGAGGIRPCSVAFGVDQLIRSKENPNNPRILQTYFSWYYVSVGVSVMIALFVIVFLQENFGWKVGFGVPAAVMFLSALAFFSGSPLYVKVKAEKSLFTGLAQVAIVSFKNRSVADPADGQYHCNPESNCVKPSKNLRFLNKACIVRDPENDINPDGTTSKPWNLCTVKQVEALKSLVRILPIWSSGIIIFMAINQFPFAPLQANTMDRHITRNVKIPAASFGIFTVTTLTIWIAIYNRAIVPLVAKLTGQPQGVSNKARMGLGLALSALSMITAALVESVRRQKAIEEGLADKPGSIVSMSAFWLAPQFCLYGLAEALNGIGQIEFYYSQLPKNMASLAMALSLANSGFSGLLGSFVMKTVNGITTRGGKPGWAPDNPNKARFDYFYWFLAILCAANFLYYLVCCWIYGPEEKPRDSCECVVV